MDHQIRYPPAIAQWELVNLQFGSEGFRHHWVQETESSWQDFVKFGRIKTRVLTYNTSCQHWKCYSSELVFNWSPFTMGQQRFTGKVTEIARKNHYESSWTRTYGIRHHVIVVDQRTFHNGKYFKEDMVWNSIPIW